MLFVDVNVVVAAFRPGDVTAGSRVREWLLEHLAGYQRVGVSELVLSSMLRIVTNPRVFNEPAAPSSALGFADALMAAPAVLRIRPDQHHWDLFRRLVLQYRLRANDIPDAYLAAMAFENGATMVTSDRGFARFDGLRVVDPRA